MNRTIVTCVGIITLGAVFIAGFYIYFVAYQATLIAAKTETRDRLTVCLDAIMTKSIEANKPIDAKLAREICG